MDFRIILLAFGVPAFGALTELGKGHYFGAGANAVTLALVTLYFIGVAFDKKPAFIKWTTQVLILAFFVLAAMAAWQLEKRMGVLVMTILGATFFPLEVLIIKLKKSEWPLKAHELMGLYFVLIYIFWFIGMI